MKDPTYAPVYCALYPKLAAITREHGYALAIHGTLARDMDLICIPWVPKPSEPQTVVEAITSRFYIRQIGQAQAREHGRVAYLVSIGHGECAIDLSFTPRVELIKTTYTGDQDPGCLCQGCGQRYRVDVLVPDELWERIRPTGKPEGAGLLCGRCIFGRIEQLGQFSALHLVDKA